MSELESLRADNFRLREACRVAAMEGAALQLDRDDLQRRVTSLVSELSSCRSGRDTEKAELAEAKRNREISDRSHEQIEANFCAELDALETRIRALADEWESEARSYETGGLGPHYLSAARLLRERSAAVRELPVVSEGLVKP